MTKFREVFNNTPILGMIHLAGAHPIKRALEELAIFKEEGIDGAIIENYHGSEEDVVKTLKETTKLSDSVIIGINILPNEFQIALPLASDYGAKFIQLDYIAGNYIPEELNFDLYSEFKKEHSNIVVLGGVWPKYYQPIEGSNLEADLKEGIQRAEAIVVTGEGTGKQTPTDKIKYFRKIIGTHPLVIGAGLTPENVYEQLCIADGAIVGTCLKVDNETSNKLDIVRIKDLMDVVKEVRIYKESF